MLKKYTGYTGVPAINTYLMDDALVHQVGILTITSHQVLGLHDCLLAHLYTSLAFLPLVYLLDALIRSPGSLTLSIRMNIYLILAGTLNIINLLHSFHCSSGHQIV